MTTFDASRSEPTFDAGAADQPPTYGNADYGEADYADASAVTVAAGRGEVVVDAGPEG